MPKQGVLHDYDLMANAEPSAEGQKCVVCESDPMTFQWSDYSGEGMCRSCGTPYQLKWGSDKQVEEGAYPYLSMNDHFLPIAREYFKETGRFVCYGMMMGPKPGMSRLIDWLEKNHPEELKSKDDSADAYEGE